MTINQGKYHNTNRHIVDLNVFSQGVGVAGFWK